MLDELLDIFRLRQYFNVITRTREWVEGLRDDAAFLTDAGRAALHLSPGANGPTAQPFAAMEPFDPVIGEGQRIALAATGGSGAMASMVGVARRSSAVRRLTLLWFGAVRLPDRRGHRRRGGGSLHHAATSRGLHRRRLVAPAAPGPDGRQGLRRDLGG